MENKARRRGRPVVGNEKTHHFDMRMSDSDKYLLDKMQEWSGKSKTEIMREAIADCYMKYVDMYLK